MSSDSHFTSSDGAKASVPTGGAVAGKPFANWVWDFWSAESEFRARLEDVGLEDYERLRYDDYDCSVELDGVGKDVRLTPEQQRVFFDAKFARVYVNHEDQWETHYSWKHGEPFKAQRGWRRFRTEKGFLISYWPEGWGNPNTGKNAEWLRTGYMTIIPDPLEATATPGTTPASETPPAKPENAPPSQTEPPVVTP